VQVSHLHSNNSASWRTDASIKLSSVVSSLKTISARAMLTAMIAGETDPLTLADLAKGKLRRKIPELAQALTGHFDANHARLARSMLRRLDLVEQALAELDAVLIEACQPWQHQIGAAANHSRRWTEGRAGDHRRNRCRHGAVPDRRPLGCLGRVGAGDARVRRASVPGRETARQQMAVRDAGRSRGIGRSDARQNYLAARHARLLKRHGMRRAQVAVAHSILVAAYWMLKRDEPYHDLGADWHRRRNNEAHTRRLVAQLEHLGHTVIINPAA
jgi:hypothetical protein